MIGSSDGTAYEDNFDYLIKNQTAPKERPIENIPDPSGSNFNERFHFPVYDPSGNEVKQPRMREIIKPGTPAWPPEKKAVVAGDYPSYETPLTKPEEENFHRWKQQYAPNDSGADYDLRGAFKEGITPDSKTGHWPDTYKKPNHPTFSNESQYAKDRPDLAGHWEGDKYIPPTDSPINRAMDLGADIQKRRFEMPLIIRHGATDFNLGSGEEKNKDYIRGHLDVPLNEEGRKEASDIADELKEKGHIGQGDLVITSDLSRAHDTAKAIQKATGALVMTDPGLRPWDLGDFQGKDYPSCKDQIEGYCLNSPDKPVPNGESFNDFKGRASDALIRAAQMGAAAVVTHHRVDKLDAALQADGSVDFDKFLGQGEDTGTYRPAKLAQLAGNVPTPDTTEKMESKFGAAPPALRMFAQTLAGDRSKITEEHFKPEELEYLRDKVEERLAKGKKTIGYGDYGEKDPFGGQSDAAGGNRIIMDALTDMGQSLAFTLGMANISKEKDGTIVIKDNYHWGAKPEKVDEIRPIHKLLPILAEAVVKHGLLGVGNVVGNLMAPQTKGRKVEIRIPPKEDKTMY